MIKNIYKETFVKSGHMQSNFLKTNLGVKQGEPLKPMLYNVFINDLVDFLVTNSRTPTLNDVTVHSYLFYADDLAIFATNPDNLQDKLDNLKTYCTK